MQVHIGCSGFHYDHWREKFYPEDLAKTKWLEYYAGHFKTVEINNSFYRMPTEKTVKNWYSVTPEKFIFSVKGPQYITHRKKLSVDEPMQSYLTQFQKIVSFLGEKTGPILWQLPGYYNPNPQKFEIFCKLISKDFDHIFEFRNDKWFNNEIYNILQKYGLGLCIVSSPKVQGVVKATSETAYIRLHGKGSMYSDNYSDQDLVEWKNKLVKLDAKKLFAYFDNDANAYAVYNAKTLAKMFGDNL
jgi:uncharacterized protein YecE (DUF72 family)